MNRYVRLFEKFHFIKTTLNDGNAVYGLDKNGEKLSSKLLKHCWKEEKTGNTFFMKEVLGDYKRIKVEGTQRLPFSLSYHGVFPELTEKVSQSLLFNLSLEDSLCMRTYHFVDPETSTMYIDHLRHERLHWWRKLARRPASFNIVRQSDDSVVQYERDGIVAKAEWMEYKGTTLLQDLQEQTGISLEISCEDGSSAYILPYVIHTFTTVASAVTAFLIDSSTRNFRLRFGSPLAPYDVAVGMLAKDGSPVCHGVVSRLEDLLKEQELNVLRLTESPEQNELYCQSDDNGVFMSVLVPPDVTAYGQVFLRQHGVNIMERIPLCQVVERIKQYIEIDS